MKLLIVIATALADVAFTNVTVAASGEDNVTVWGSISLTVCSARVLEDQFEGYKEGDRYFYFPGDGDGIVHLVDTLEPEDTAFLNDLTRNPDNNAYHLFTRANSDNPQLIVLNNGDSVQTSFFDGRKDTVIITHGWNGHAGNDNCVTLTRAFLQDNDVNVIVLDWRNLANRSYITARNGVPAVGRRLGEFILWMTNFGLSLERLHLVGFSLGGHLVGIAGRESGGLVKRITALDPAGPLWYSNSNRLKATDAQYVEVIHTSTNLGYTDPCGDADFYPNGGTSMPGCWVSPCSHSKAWEYMAATITYDHLFAHECSSHRDASRNRCSGELYEMGNSNINKSRAGIYRVNTGSNYPF